MKKRFTLFLTTLPILTLSVQYLTAADIKGKVFDASNKEPIIGAVVIVKESSNKAAATDIDGSFTIKDVTLPTTITVSYAGSQTQDIEVTNEQELNITLEPEAISVQSVSVVRRRRQNTETAMIASLRGTNAVAVGISGAQISKTSDSDAGEVVRRIPGISLIDGRFIIVRGLAQRYNNVWINGGGVPSTEADGRAFSFDIIPSGNIDNIVISKSFSADLPGDFSGGFIKITTKDAPEQSSVQFGIASGFNTQTHFKDMRLGNGSSTDWLGFDASKRPLSSDFPANLRSVSNPTTLNNIYQNGFNNDWSVRTFRPLPDIKANVQWNSHISDKVAMVLTASYQNTYKTISDMINRRYGIYNSASDAPSVEKDYIDNQYTNEVKLGVMNNWTFRVDDRNRIEFRNLFNIMSKNRLMERAGWSLVSGGYYESQTEFLYSSRLTYTGQLAGNHTLGNDKSNIIDWNGTYSYAYRDEPDRRIVSNIGLAPVGTQGNDIETYNDRIRRYYQNLMDNTGSLALNYTKRFNGASWQPTLKSGLYSEYRARNYSPREFTYNYDNLSVDERDHYIYLPYEEMVSSKWMGTDKVTINETGSLQNAYNGDYFVGAGYVTTTLPVGKFIFDVGVRAEWWNMSVTYDRSMDSSRPLMTTNKYNELSILPALNISYNISPQHTLRASYGRTVNRPEFREVSPTIYYDFELFAEIQGNPELKMATIDNADIRYEYYPTPGEILSVGLFYKHFANPIEWNFRDMGGTYRYSFENAKSAYTAGVEVDIRKNLDFIGVPELALVFNGALTMSQVEFRNEGLVKQKERPLQGQSPYIVNVGLYYNSDDKLGLSASVLYNIIGKRIVGIGRSTSLDSNSDNDLPDSYEMPRNIVDLTVSKRFAKRFEAKLGVKNILNAPVVFKQFPTTTIDGVQQSREQLTREYYPGVSFSLGLSVKF